MSRPQVVITQTGICSPLGTGLDEFTLHLEKGFRGIGTITHYDADAFPVRFGAEARGRDRVFQWPSAVDRKARFMHEAIRQVFAERRAISTHRPSDRLLNLGTGIDYFDLEGYIDSGDAASGCWEKHCRRSLGLARELAEEFDIRGGTTVNLSACVASTQAIGLSYRVLKTAPGKVSISGGTDSMLNPLSYMGFFKLGAFSQWKGDPALSCRPFDKRRSGLVLGEGAVALVMERAEDTTTAEAMGEIAGYASTMDAYMITDPLPEGAALAKAAIQAIAEAGITSDDIDCVHLHETGTLKNAIAETNAMRKIFGDRYTEVPVFSLKGQVGHLIGACGAIEVVAALHSLRTQTVLPTVNFEERDEEVPLRIVRDQPLRIRIDHVLKLNSAFGGQNAALVLRRIHA